MDFQNHHLLLHDVSHPYLERHDYCSNTKLFGTRTHDITYHLLIAGDVHSNPGPQSSAESNISTDSSAQSNPYQCFQRRGLNFLHLNTQSIIPKLSEIRLIVEQCRAAAFCVTETWLDASCTDDEVKNDGYLIIRRDRNSNGGGVCMYIRTDLAFMSELTSLTITLKQFGATFFYPNRNPFYLEQSTIRMSILLAF